jgi:hypothetical protein
MPIASAEAARSGNCLDNTYALNYSQTSAQKSTNNYNITLENQCIRLNRWDRLRQSLLT